MQQFQQTLIRLLVSKLLKQWNVLVEMALLPLKKQKAWKDELDVVEGMQFDRGYISPYFVTDAEKMEAVFEDPFILNL